jgi:site-specific DNA recombinase
LEAEHLRIVPQPLWKKVHERLAWLKSTYAQTRPGGLMSRSAGSRHLFSGLLVCSECGGNLTIISGHGKLGHARYGCPRNFNRGTCTNDLKERHDRLEARLLEGLQEAVLQPHVIDYTLDRFERELKKQLQSLSGQMDGLRRRKRKLEAELQRLTKAVAEGGHSTFLLEGIAERERELRSHTQTLVTGEPGSIQASLANLREFVHSRLADVKAVLYADLGRSRIELAKHVSKIIMRPVTTAGERYYLASGEWRLLGEDLGISAGNLEMVAGACNALNLPLFF